MNRLYVMGSVALATAGALSIGFVDAQADAGKRARRKERKDLVVTLATPTNNQEVLPDLSDPGLNNVITVRFSSSVRRRDIKDPNNAFNQLTSKVDFLDSTFSRLGGKVRVRRNVFIFDPRLPENNGVLTDGQYTLTLKRSIANRRGRLLNFGARDYTTTFAVGTDVYPPVLRKISPIDGQTNIGLTQRVVATFNEPIDPNTVATNVIVQDASTNPPTIIPGAGGGGTGVTVERNGFDVVFTPDPCFGYPPNTRIQFLVFGAFPLGASSALTDVFGNEFTRDPGLQWSPSQTVQFLFQSPNGEYDDLLGIFRMQFTTKGVRPPPVGLVPGSPQYAGLPICAPCGGLLWAAPSCMCGGSVFFYQTSTGIGEISLAGFVNRFNQGITDFTLLSIVPNSPVRLGRPSGMVVDPRFDATTLHTFLYLVDQRTATIRVLDSRNLATLGRFTGFSSPRDVSISTDTSLSRTTLYVSDFASNQVVGVDLQSIAVTFTGQPGAPSVCDSIKDQQERRLSIPTGRGPTSVTADYYLLSRVLVTNTLDNSVTQINVQDNTVRNTLNTGSSPVDSDWVTIQFGAIRAALIANQGGLNDPDGSVSLYIGSPSLGGGLLGAGQIRDGIESTLTDGIKNPTDVWGNGQWIDPPPPAGTLTSRPIVWYIPNTGGNTIVELRLAVTGLFGTSITAMSPGGPREVGQNPTFASLDPFYPNAFLFAAVAGTGQFVGMDPSRAISPQGIRVPGLGKIFSCYTK